MPHLYFISDQVSHRRGPAFLGRQESPDADQEFCKAQQVGFGYPQSFESTIT